jgi:hypothetical protein
MEELLLEERIKKNDAIRDQPVKLIMDPPLNEIVMDPPAYPIIMDPEAKSRLIDEKREEYSDLKSYMNHCLNKIVGFVHGKTLDEMKIDSLRKKYTRAVEIEKKKLDGYIEHQKQIEIKIIEEFNKFSDTYKIVKGLAEEIESLEKTKEKIEYDITQIQLISGEDTFRGYINYLNELELDIKTKIGEADNYANILNESKRNFLVHSKDYKLIGDAISTLKFALVNLEYNTQNSNKELDTN